MVLPAVATPPPEMVVTVLLDLDGRGGIDFLAMTLVQLPSGEIDTANTDSAPSAALGRYRMVLPTRLLVRSTSISPGRPVAGGRFSARAFVRDATLGAPGTPASGGAVTCRFSVGGRAVSTKGAISAAGRASCEGSVPAATSGQRLTGTLRYRQGGATVTRTFGAGVR